MLLYRETRVFFTLSCQTQEKEAMSGLKQGDKALFIDIIGDVNGMERQLRPIEFDIIE
jgi:hypothetical protein